MFRRIVYVVVVLTVLGLPALADDYCVSVAKARIYSRPSALSPVVAEVGFKTVVKIVGDVKVLPRRDSQIKDESSDIPGWLKVEVGTDEGYLPVRAVADMKTVASAEGEAMGIGVDVGKVRKNFSDSEDDVALSTMRGFSEKEDDVALSTMRGFSEKEDDVALSTMKGANGKGKISAALVKVDFTVLSAKCGIPAEALKSFLFAGEFEQIDYRPESIPSDQGFVASSRKRDLITPEQIEKFEKLKQLVKNKPDEDLKMAMKAMEAMIAQSAAAKIDAGREYAIGYAVAKRVLPMYRPLPPGDKRSMYVNSVGQVLAAASNDPMVFAGYRVMLVESQEVNAFALPGGFLFVTTAMLDFVKDEDELACVIAHEIAHVELRHGMKSVGNDAIMKLFSIARDIVGKDAKSADERKELDKMMDMVAEIFMKCIRDGYGTKLEGQADWRGVQLAARLGYDSSAFFDVVQRLRRKDGTWGSGYPAHRAEDVNRYRAEFGFDKVRVSGRAVRKVRFEATIRQSVNR